MAHQDHGFQLSALSFQLSAFSLQPSAFSLQFSAFNSQPPIPMDLPTSPFADFDEEMRITRRVLERVPGEKGKWKPHEKSFSLGHLAQLVALMPGWIARSLNESAIDLGASPGYTYETTETLLSVFDQNVEAARDALREATDETLDEPWSLKRGKQVLLSMPKRAVVRQTISHLSHHRGQLTVYLRLLDVAVPSIYGPSADEKW
jgi:uncharacterized damage-inducible protein DinB